MVESLQRGHVVVHGVGMSYVEREAVAGSADAPLLLLHGLIATGETFASLIAHMPITRRVVALDLPGAGFSERCAEADVSFAGMAALVAGFMEQVGLERPVLLGHSHGGACALRLAASRPDALRAVILMAPAHPWSGYERAIVAFYLSGFGRRIARLMPYVPEPLHWWAFKSMSGPQGKRDRAVLKYYRASGKVPGTVVHTLRLLETWQADMDSLREDLTAEPIRLPTLLLWGDHDRVVPERTAAALKRHLTRWEHVTLPGIGHLPNEEAAESCGRLIRTWLIWLDTLPKYADATVTTSPTPPA